LTSQEQLSERYTGSPRNIPGTQVLAAPANGATTQTKASGDNYTRTQTNSQYQVSKRVEHIDQAPGKVEKLSVAVLLDQSASVAVANTIKQTVASAVGIDTTRGDSVTVDRIPFDTSASKSEAQEMAKAESQERMAQYVKYGAMAAVAIVFLLFFRSFLRAVKPVGVTETYSRPLTLQEAEALAGGSGEAMGQSGGFELRSGEEAGPPRLSNRRPSEVAQERPEEVANLVRGWLTEGN
jgi:flagellar M-ring protein FliF